MEGDEGPALGESESEKTPPRAPRRRGGVRPRRPEHTGGDLLVATHAEQAAAPREPTTGEVSRRLRAHGRPQSARAGQRDRFECQLCLLTSQIA